MGIDLNCLGIYARLHICDEPTTNLQSTQASENPYNWLVKQSVRAETRRLPLAVRWKAVSIGMTIRTVARGRSRITSFWNISVIRKGRHLKLTGSALATMAIIGRCTVHHLQAFCQQLFHRHRAVFFVYKPALFDLGFA
jgi:hypothetical protein